MTEDRPISRKKLEARLAEKMLDFSRKGQETDCEQARFGFSVSIMTLQAVLNEIYAGNFDP